MDRSVPLLIHFVSSKCSEDYTEVIFILMASRVTQKGVKRKASIAAKCHFGRIKIAGASAQASEVT